MPAVDEALAGFVDALAERRTRVRSGVGATRATTLGLRAQPRPGRGHPDDRPRPARGEDRRRGPRRVRPRRHARPVDQRRRRRPPSTARPPRVRPACRSTSHRRPICPTPTTPTRSATRSWVTLPRLPTTAPVKRSLTEELPAFTNADGLADVSFDDDGGLTMTGDLRPRRPRQPHRGDDQLRPGPRRRLDHVPRRGGQRLRRGRRRPDGVRLLRPDGADDHRRRGHGVRLCGARPQRRPGHRVLRRADDLLLLGPAQPGAGCPAVAGARHRGRGVRQRDYLHLRRPVRRVRRARPRPRGHHRLGRADGHR